MLKHKSKSARRLQTSGKLSESQVIERLIHLLKAFPDAGKGLPGNAGTQAYWRRFFSSSERASRLLEAYRELPLFIRVKSRGARRTDWLAVLKKDFPLTSETCPSQVGEVIRRVLAATMNLSPPQKLQYWRDHFGATEVVQRVRPLESNAYLHNPHRGTATFQRFQGDDVYSTWLWSDTHGPTVFDPAAPVKDNVQYIPRTTLSYCRWPWKWLEPEKGKFNWKLVDTALKTAKARGQTLQLRFEPYTEKVDYSQTCINATRHPPEMSVNVPDWYWDTGAAWIPKGPYHRHEPDSNDPKYFKHFGEFVKAFARRYDGHPDLESVDIAVAGMWGESGGNSTPETRAALVSLYRNYFKKTQLIGMLGTRRGLEPDNPDGQGGLPVGFRADCFGDLRKLYGKGVPPDLCWNHTFDTYVMEMTKAGVTDVWQKAPVTMESCWNVPGWFIDGYDLDVIIREGYRYHMSVFMPKSNYFPEAWMEKLIEFDKKIGYRYAIRQITLPIEVAPGQAMTVPWFIDNVGCAPLYRPYRLALRFRQGSKARVVCFKQDIRTWLPGHKWFEETILVPKGLKKGEVKIDVAIVGDKDQPKVWFALDDKTEDGWHPVASMDITG